MGSFLFSAATASLSETTRTLTLCHHGRAAARSGAAQTRDRCPDQALMTHDDPGSAKRHFAPHGVRDDAHAHIFVVIPGATQRAAVRRRPGTVVWIERP
jgi:hypothetical protein